MMEGNFKPTLKTYCDIVPEDRIQELELHAFHLMSGEDIENTLRAEEKGLDEEYSRLAYGED